MQTFTLSIGLGLISAVFGAAANLSARQIMRLVSPRDYLAINFGLLFLWLLPAAPFLGRVQLSAAALGALLAAALVDAAANYLYFQAFEQNDAASASMLLSLSPLFTLALAPFFAAQAGAVSWAQALGVAAVVVGLVLAARGVTPQAGGGARSWAAPLGAAALFGANFYLLKWIFAQGYANPLGYYFLRAGLIAFLAWAVLRPRWAWVNGAALRLSAGRALLVVMQWLLLLYALQMGSPAVVKAASDSSPLFVMAFLALFWKARLLPRQWAAAGCILAGLALVTLGG